MSKNKKNKKFNKNMNPTEKNQPQDEEVLKNQEKTEEAALDEETQKEAAEELSAEEKVNKDLADAQKTIEEQHDKYLRLSAEFDNYRKRTLKEKMDLVQTGGRDVLLAMLPVRDDVQRAVDAMQKSDDIEALRSGKEILVEDIHLKDGRVISGHARVDANRGDVVFRNDNNPHLRIHDTVFGVKVSTDIQAKLANHEVVFIPGMKVGGKTISTDLRYSDTGRPLFGNNARNYRSRLGEENPRPRQRVRRRLPSLPGAQPKGMKIG